ncbi:MAG: T9SS type A sorting domain-containing protein [Flavobacteriales bacterium]|nr:T9SS type A sorting domain-containing protein [Flavobacteriales bacterium]
MNQRSLTLQISTCFVFISLIFFSNKAVAQCDAVFDYGGQDTVCINATVFLTDQSTAPNGVGAWEWSTGGNQLPGAGGLATFQPLEEGIYSILLVMYDSQLTCSSQDSVNIVVLGNPSPNIEVVDISCHGECDGTANVLYESPNAAAYTATWSIGGTEPLTGLCAGNYIATISDNFGCSSTVAPVVGQVIEPDPLTSNISNGATVLGCEGDPDITLNVGVFGGTPNANGAYSVLWSPAAGISDVFQSITLLTPSASNLFQVYTANITDDRGCTTSSNVQLLPSTSQVEGVISIAGSPCANCEVAFFKPEANEWTRLFTGVTNGSGNYVFGTVPGMMDFRLMADPDDAFHPNVLQGYYTGSTPTHLWEQATSLNSGCGTTSQKNIDLPAAVAHNGQCTLRGALYQLVPGKSQTEEDPIPLIDVVVEKTPPGSAQAKATTDINGEFEFNLMEVSDTLYSLYVNIPGLPMNQTHQISIDAGDLLYDQLDLCVNLEGTFISTCTALNIEQPTEENTAITVYPNPNNGNFQVKMGAFLGENSQISIFDVSGRVVLVKSFQQTPQEFQFSGLNQGYYLIRIHNDQRSEFVTLSITP